MKHTKGPWHANPGVMGGSWTIRSEYSSLINDVPLAYLKADEREGADVEANAHLIAAAPELLQACLYALNRLNHATMYGPDMQSSRDLCIQDARDLLGRALEKAEGK